MKRINRLLIWVVLCTLGVFAQETKKVSKGTMLTKLKLPIPVVQGTTSFEAILVSRPVAQKFMPDELTLAQISQLAWAGQGIIERNKMIRTTSSVDDVYPISVYFAIRGGVYVYDPNEHVLEKVVIGNVLSGLSSACSNQVIIKEAPCTVIIAGEPKKILAKYGPEGRRMFVLEGGAVAQNIQLQAISLGLASVPIWNFDSRSVAGICRFRPGQEVLQIIAVGYPQGGTSIKAPELQKEFLDFSKGKAKKILFIISPQGFRSDEFFDIRDVLLAMGSEVYVSSSKLGTIRDTKGGSQVEPTVLINELVVQDYDAVVLVSGIASDRYPFDPMLLDIVQEAVRKKLVVGAIGLTPEVLAKAGVLEGRRATSDISRRSKLLKAGADYTGAYVERDDLIITAQYSRAAGEFARAIGDALLRREAASEEGTTFRRRPGRLLRRSGKSE
ncbi:MAG: DJ-1/PfpI family protein [Planctomycetota bacterium]